MPCMNNVNKDPMGFSCVLKTYLKPLSASVKEKTGLQFGVDASAFLFRDILQISTLSMMNPIGTSNYISSSVMADKSGMLETLRHLMQIPILYINYASIILSKLDSFSKVAKVSNTTIHNYFHHINYEGPRSISDDKQEKLVNFFKLIYERYRGDWREIIYSFHNQKKRDSMIPQSLDHATKNLIPTTVCQLNLYCSLTGNLII